MDTRNLTGLAMKNDEEIVRELLELRARYAKLGALRWVTRPLLLRALRKWSVSNALQIPMTLPVKKLYWGYGMHSPEETPSLVPRWSIVMLHVLAVAYANPIIVGDKMFFNLLKELDPRGHRFCGMADLFEILTKPESPLSLVLSACGSIFNFTRDVPFSDMNMRNLTSLVRALVKLTSAEHHLRVVGNPSKERCPIWHTLAREAATDTQEIDESFDMPQLTEKIRKAAKKIEEFTEKKVRSGEGYKEDHTRVDMKASDIRFTVRELRKTIHWLGIQNELRQWIVC